MDFALSTLMFLPKDFNTSTDFAPEILEKSIDFAGELGMKLEVFPLWHLPSFSKFIDNRFADLRQITASLHEPYHFCDHSFRRGTKEYEKTVELCHKTFETAARLGAKSIVFHHNNRHVSSAEREEMIQCSAENLHEMNTFAAEYNVACLVENVGIPLLQNALFDEDEFISLFDTIPNDCLIDIGHTHCNSWDLERVISTLKHKILAYHVHDNDKSSDQHRMLGRGTIDIEQFREFYYAHTPKAQIILEYAEGTKATILDIKEEMKKVRGDFA